MTGHFEPACPSYHLNNRRQLLPPCSCHSRTQQQQPALPGTCINSNRRLVPTPFLSRAAQAKACCVGLLHHFGHLVSLPIQHPNGASWCSTCLPPGPAAFSITHHVAGASAALQAHQPAASNLLLRCRPTSWLQMGGISHAAHHLWHPKNPAGEGRAGEGWGGLGGSTIQAQAQQLLAPSHSCVQQALPRMLWCSSPLTRQRHAAGGPPGQAALPGGAWWGGRVGS